MLEMLSHGFMARAFMAGAIIGALCAVVSVFIVLKKISFIGVGVSHSAFGGVAIGALLGVNLTVSVFVFSTFVALLIGWLSRRSGAHEDISIGVVFSSSMALGVVALGLMEGYNIDMFSFLFGSILAVSNADLWVALGALLFVTLVIAILFKELLAYCFDEQWARVCGINVNRLQDTLLVLIAVTVVVSIKLLGIILVSALLVMPGAIGHTLAENYRGQFVISILSALASVFTGLTLSYYFDIASGATIVLSSAFLFLLATIFSRKVY
ncbi:Zinc ABC transporter, inner membrane permease protein ZnuB [hydrothermal vent metagenome]|uniref:Zinc ABC transporter, inner membrane permease protein ZnuB n=1 Tax=hydrothermal vent metagenome TaxID=652676 RepID=A0A3B1CFS7_9ZZZZ